ncbi:MAG: hypothetical protein J5895_01740 [Alphaproteobacteria bacterium]|nr:hypothetical protein [Alphaproteobacteria bacterium]
MLFETEAFPLGHLQAIFFSPYLKKLILLVHANGYIAPMLLKQHNHWLKNQKKCRASCSFKNRFLYKLLEKDFLT